MTRIFTPCRPSLRALVFAGLYGLAPAPVGAAIVTEQENNDVESRANGPIASGIAVSGRMADRRDVDWFFFDLAAPANVQVSLDHAQGRDFDWALYAASGPALARGDTASIPDAGAHDAGMAGRYLVKVTAYSGRGDYTLEVTTAGSGGGDPRPGKPGNLVNWITGNAADAGRDPVGGPALLLMGGGAEVDEAFAQRALSVANGGDLVILRTSGSDGYNDYLYNLVTGPARPDSVETLLLDTRAKADSDYAEWVVRNAELVFIAGGDQSDYLNQWQGTRTEQALHAAYDRGAVIGGTSAGLAVQGEFVYDPDGVLAVTSDEALDDPYRSGMQFSQGFLDLPLMNDIITDSHFHDRDRLGRLLAFMARLREDNLTARIIGVGIDENTSLFIDATGLGLVDGDGAVYVAEERGDTERVQVNPGQPLVYRNLRRTRLWAGDAYDFDTGTHDGDSIVVDVDGRASQPFTPVNPY